MMKLTSKVMSAAALLTIGFALPALAADVTNSSKAEIIVLVTEDGTRSELTVAVGQKINFCEEGCFVTLPNGDRHALTGTEAIDISDGLVTIN